MANNSIQLNAIPVVYDMPVSVSLTASQATSTPSLATFTPVSPTQVSTSSYQIYATENWVISRLVLPSQLTTDLLLSFTIAGTQQNFYIDVNQFAYSEPSALRSLITPVILPANITFQINAYPLTAVTTAATETFLVEVVRQPVMTPIQTSATSGKA